MAQLGELASQMYVGNPTIGAEGQIYNIKYDPNSSVSKALGLTPRFFLWSSKEESSIYARYRRFDTTESRWNYNGDRDDSYIQAVCLGE